MIQNLLNLSDPIPQYAIDAGKNLVAKLKKIFPIPDGGIDRTYYHWAVASHGHTFTDYNLMIVLINGSYQLVVTCNPQNNVAGFNDNKEASHTEHRNTGAIGISCDGMDGASINGTFGPDALDLHTIYMMAAAGAAVAIAYNLDANGKVTKDRPHLDDTNTITIHTVGEPIFATHAECAVWDNYPADRWDWALEKPLSEGESLTIAQRTEEGDRLRQLTHLMKLELLKD